MSDPLSVNEVDTHTPRYGSGQNPAQNAGHRKKKKTPSKPASENDTDESESTGKQTITPEHLGKAIDLEA